MKGIILAGGNGTRLYPITKSINKHLLPIGRYPMIYYSIAKLKQALITDIMIISSKKDIGSLAKLLGNGNEFGMEFTYRVQEKAGGIAEALGLCEKFVGLDKCVVMLGDNIFYDNIKPFVDKFRKQDKGAKVLIKEVKDPTRYGIADIYENKIVNIEEKPKKPKSNYCVTGIYMYDNQVFDVIKKLKPSSRNELEITDVNNCYIKQSYLSYDVLKNWWIDAGTISSLMSANILAKDIDLMSILDK
ncbi:sugar phosphate nucleotidyltransferase [Clostridium ganghwense]|uniref:Glucose-1-phosphate thymidylyltransferase n=1 Tax=Clostridium ganghwense TaxID=312089 RepID=A0ABT4CN98_9CLOT|nr:sugar phosphate nucleotidyltransferase [Clostridium ganghwense]MCY6370537.1 sugar phosphate nucleotidyltransferase [Clostridium ganghwense]